MAKKTITKEHPITAFRKANEARDVVVKSSMKKMQIGGTPYQEYMKTPGAVASDTIVTRQPLKGVLNSKGEQAYSKVNLDKPVSKNPKNKQALINATEKTYGMDVWDRPGYGYTRNKYLTPEQEKEFRRMGPMKKGGAVKSKKK
jgi:hypothetical protein